MPEAIATTKRKFYRALDALSASSNASSLPSTSSATTPPSSSKRSSTVAFDEARERVRKRLRQSTSTDSLDANRNRAIISVSGRSTSTLPNTSTPVKSPPNFSPWSQETFLARLKTFSKVSQWHPKPDVINEVEWAKRGWVCVDVNTVACKGGCGRRVLVSIDAPRQRDTQNEDGTEEENDEEEESLFEDALAERYKEQIVEGHSPTCLWRGEGCKDDIYRLPVVRTSIWQPQLRQRLHSLLAILPSIEHVKTRPLESFDEKVFDDLPPDVLAVGDPPATGSAKAFVIAMHGWRGSSESGNDLLHCDACFQRVGLWMYQPDYQRPRFAISDPQDDDDVDEEPSLLDLAELHRDHCPWRNPATQKATGSLDGLNACQVLQRVVSTAARDHRRRSGNQTANDADEDVANSAVSPVQLSREEISRTDKERESKLRRLKNMFNIKRRPTTRAPPQPQKTA